MKARWNLCVIIALFVVAFAVANGQSTNGATKHYDNGVLAFDYPEGWVLTENTSKSVQTLTRNKAGSVVEIIVTMENPARWSCDFQLQRKQIADVLIEVLATRIHSSTPRSALPVRTQIGGSEVQGTRLKGVINKTSVTGDVYSTRLNQRFVSLVYVVGAVDESALATWNTVRNALRTTFPVLAATAAETTISSQEITSGALNGKAVSLPQPQYSPLARSARATGTVTIQVVIDETGSVIAAHPVEGHPLLRPASLAAAKQARFSPTKLCGEPVRVTGVITYNFVAR
jgi:TonB family protein